MNKSAREAEFKRDWLNRHSKADEVVANAHTGELIAAIYYYPPAHHAAEQKKIWQGVADRMSVDQQLAHYYENLNGGKQ